MHHSVLPLIAPCQLLQLPIQLQLESLVAPCQLLHLPVELQLESLVVPCQLLVCLRHAPLRGLKLYLQFLCSVAVRLRCYALMGDAISCDLHRNTMTSNIYHNRATLTTMAHTHKNKIVLIKINRMIPRFFFYCAPYSLVQSIWIKLFIYI